jgi:hypothetical protein
MLINLRLCIHHIYLSRCEISYSEFVGPFKLWCYGLRDYAIQISKNCILLFAYFGFTVKMGGMLVVFKCSRLIIIPLLFLTII